VPQIHCCEEFFKHAIRTITIDSPFPLLLLLPQSQIGNNSIRVQDSSGSSTVVDISFAADGSLAAGLGQLNPTADFTKTVIYTEFVTVVRDIFVGYVSWSRSDLYPISQLQDPQNVNCTQAALHQMAWQSSPISDITLTFMESAFSDADQVGGQIYGVTAAMTELQYLVSYILATVPDTADALAGDIPTPLAVGTVCGGPDMLPDGSPETLLAMGLIADFGTGMTVTGVVLQVLVAFFALLSLISLFWTPPSLITTWPAQWLSLLSEFDSSIIRDTIRGTSTGLNAAQGSEIVYLSSRRTSGERYPQLELSGAMGRIEIGKKHM